MSGQRQGKKSHIKNTHTNQHTKIKALSLGSLGYNSFKGRPHASIESGGGLSSSGLLIGSSWGCQCYHEVVWTSCVVLGHQFFFVLQLWLIISSQISGVIRHMSDQSDGPLPEEHAWTHSLLTKPDGWRTISILVQSACLVLYLRSVLCGLDDTGLGGGKGEIIGGN